MSYVDGFVLAVPKKKIAEYQKLAKKAGKIWIEHGALSYCECVGDDLKSPTGIPFPQLVKPKAGEVIVFAWILYKSRAHRDRVNGKVMKDPRIQCDPIALPFDWTRMTYGGFKTLVSL